MHADHMAGRPLHGGADRNRAFYAATAGLPGRPLHGGADRNLMRSNGGAASIQSPPSRGRGSKRCVRSDGATASRRPLHGGADRNEYRLVAVRSEYRRPLHGGADRNWALICAIGIKLSSPPSRGRGSKQRAVGEQRACRRVAPFTGARIETSQPLCARRGSVVAPFTGARIETTTSGSSGSPNSSPPSRGRGSKLHTFRAVV